MLESTSSLVTSYRSSKSSSLRAPAYGRYSQGSHEDRKSRRVRWQQDQNQKSKEILTNASDELTKFFDTRGDEE